MYYYTVNKVFFAVNSSAVGAAGGITDPLRSPLSLSLSFFPPLSAPARAFAAVVPLRLGHLQRSSSLRDSPRPPSLTPPPALSLSGPSRLCRPLRAPCRRPLGASGGPLRRSCWVWVNPRGSPLRRTGNPLSISCCNVDFNLDFMVVRICIVRLV